ncbi:hypothetical protein EDD21DRAFT_351281 [Dissophora ornata]|nr:hypothetical protein BGZ58_002507 [Dissophora ornata]KAI8604048.1 hypothetical protein EDD21DRAFT_351281 [Dissophora ornata]
MIFSKTIATLATLASLMTFAEADMLSISNPAKGTKWKVGETVFLQWKGNCALMADSAAKAVDVNLMSGPETALRFVAKLASIDCSDTDTRKEFTIPSNVVAYSGSYSLQVQTEPQPSYSNIFTIENAADSASTAVAVNGAGAAGAAGTSNGTSLIETASSSHQNAAAGSPLKSLGSTTTASAVALAAFVVAAQLL